MKKILINGEYREFHEIPMSKLPRNALEDAYRTIMEKQGTLVPQKKKRKNSK